MSNPEQPIIIPKGKVFESYRELTPQEEAELASAGSRTKERADKRAPGTTGEQLVIARELFGSDFLGPEAVENVWGVHLEAKDIPPIPFSPAELKRAKELNQQLVLRINKAPDGTSLTMQEINEMVQPKLSQGGKGKLLLNVDWYAAEQFYTSELPEFAWALVSKGPIPDSKGKNYLEQTEAMVVYLQNEVFQGMDIPIEYRDAIAEFYSKKAGLAPLIDTDWKEAAKQLSELKINQLTRPTPVEAIYDVATNLLQNDERHLESTYTWTRRRGSGGRLVGVGRADSDGAGVYADGPDYRIGSLGVSFSRSR